mmetsp:Transcript_133488/g.302801  ORF Transcript_133488/g.302801 Transcript_133488/m.302801 type:complete len:209 (-) Transcript_133488:1-627(-)
MRAGKHRLHTLDADHIRHQNLVLQLLLQAALQKPLFRELERVFLGFACVHVLQLPGHELHSRVRVQVHVVALAPVVSFHVHVVEPQLRVLFQQKIHELWIRILDFLGIHHQLPQLKRRAPLSPFEPPRLIIGPLINHGTHAPNSIPPRLPSKIGPRRVNGSFTGPQTGGGNMQACRLNLHGATWTRATLRGRRPKQRSQQHGTFHSKS